VLMFQWLIFRSNMHYFYAHVQTFPSTFTFANVLEYDGILRRAFKHYFKIMQK